MARWRRGPVGWGLGPFATHAKSPAWRSVGLSTLFTPGGTSAEFAANIAPLGGEGPTLTASLLTGAATFAASATAEATATSGPLITDVRFFADAQAEASLWPLFDGSVLRAAAVGSAQARLFERANSGGRAFLSQFGSAGWPTQSGTLLGSGYLDKAVIFSLVPHSTSVVGVGVVDDTGEWTLRGSIDATEGGVKWILTAWEADLLPTPTRTWSFTYSSPATGSYQGVLGVMYVRGGEFVAASGQAYALGTGDTLWVPPALANPSNESFLASAWFSRLSLVDLNTAQRWRDISPDFLDTEDAVLIGYAASAPSLTIAGTPLLDDRAPAQRGVISHSYYPRGALSLLYRGQAAADHAQFSAVARCTSTASGRLGNAPAPAPIQYLSHLTSSSGNLIVWRPNLGDTPAPGAEPNDAVRATTREYFSMASGGKIGDLIVMFVMTDFQEFDLLDPGWHLAAPVRRMTGLDNPRYRLMAFWRYDDYTNFDDGATDFAPSYSMQARGIGTFDTPYDCQALITAFRFRDAKVVTPDYLFAEGVEAANSGFVSAAEADGIGQGILGTTLARAPNTAASVADSVVLAMWGTSQNVSYASTTLDYPAGYTTLPTAGWEYRNSTEQLRYSMFAAYKVVGAGQTGDLDLTYTPVRQGRVGVAVVIRPQGTGALFHATPAVCEPAAEATQLVGTILLAATPSALATATANLLTAPSASFAADATCSAFSEASLLTGVLFFADSAAEAAGTGDLALGQGFAAEPSALATLFGDLDTRVPVFSDGYAVASASASLDTVWPMYASPTAQAEAQAALRAAPQFYALAQAVASFATRTADEKPPKASWALLMQAQSTAQTRTPETTYRRPI